MSDYDKLKSIYDKIDVLIEKRVDSSSPEFQAWKVKAERFLIKKFGEKSFELDNFRSYPFSLMCFSINTSNNEFVKACADDLQSIKAIFSEYLQDLEVNESEDATLSEQDKLYCYNKIFIVHGHNGELKETVARLIERQGINPVILHEQVNLGATIIEKIEKNSDVHAAICLFTADDIGRLNGKVKENRRARQNVVFETGYFMGKLGRTNTIIVSENDIEIPSDLQGIVYVDTNEWKFKILKELKGIGYNIDYNKIDM